jgi:hypothetical protein
MIRKLLVGVAILIVLGLIYFVPSQSDSVNTGQAFGDQPTQETVGEQEPNTATTTAPAPAASPPPDITATQKKVDTSTLNEVDASLNDDIESAVGDSL